MTRKDVLEVSLRVLAAWMTVQSAVTYVASGVWTLRTDTEGSIFYFGIALLVAGAAWMLWRAAPSLAGAIERSQAGTVAALEAATWRPLVFVAVGVYYVVNGVSNIAERIIIRASGGEIDYVWDPYSICCIGIGLFAIVGLEKTVRALGRVMRW